MCVIIHLPKDIIISDNMLYNAAANNWNSWGIIVKKNGKLEVTKRVNPKGSHEDIKEIVEILHNNIGHERYVHFRHTTKGATDLDNAHPFLVYKDKKREVYFMHNGTFTTYGNGEDKSKSDTLDFVENALKPIFENWKNGGDYTDPQFRKFVLDPAFNNAGGNCRGLLVSNDLPPIRLGTWVRFNIHGYAVYGENAGEAWSASNDSYFKDISRGPVKEFLDREKARKEAEEAAKNPPMVVIDMNSHNRLRIDYDTRYFKANSAMMEGLTAYFHDYTLLDDSSLAAMDTLSHEEVMEFIDHMDKCKQPEAVGLFIEHLLSRISVLHYMNNKLNRSKENAEKIIISLKQELALINNSLEKMEVNKRIG